MNKRIIIWTLMIFMLSSIAYALPNATTDLMMYYEFEACGSPILDTGEGGYNEDLVVDGTLTLTTGVVGGACVFTTDRINTSTFSDSGEVKTIEYWLYKTIETGMWSHYLGNVWANDLVSIQIAAATDTYNTYNYDGGVAMGQAGQLSNETSTLNGWDHIVAVYADDDYRLYKNGNLIAWNTSATVNTVPSGQSAFTIGGAGHTAVEKYSGYVDNFAIWNYSFDNASVLWAFNNSGGRNYSAAPIPPPPAYNFSFTNEDPTNGSTIFSEILPYQLNLTFNYSSNESTTDCSLDVNGLDTVNETFNVINDTQQINYTFTTEVNFQEYTFTLNCTDPSFSETQEKQLFILMDETEPAIMIYSPAVNNSTIIIKGIDDVLDLNITVFDENLLNATVNIWYPNGSLYYTNNTFNTSQDYINFTEGNFSFDDEPAHIYTVQVLAADGHTKKDIDFSEWDIQKSQTNKLIDYGNCAVYPDETSKIDTFDYDCQDDRCTWTYTYKNVESVRNFYYECDQEMIYLPDSDYLGHFVSGDNWIDAETVENLDVTITRLTDHKYKVSYNGVDITEITTKSIGELNKAEQNVTFNVTHLFRSDETFDNNTVEFIPHNLTMQVVNKSIEFDVINNVTISYDGVLYPTVSLGNDTYMYIGTDLVAGAIANRTVEHHWISVVTPLGSNHTHEFNTTAVNHTAWNYLINDTQQVTAFQNTQFLNVSVFDEITGQPINITVDVNLVFDNSYHNVTKAKTFDQNQTFSYYVTPNSSIKNMTIAMYGSIILSGTYNNITYITRSIDINQGDPIMLYNNGTVFPLSLYAIGVENSTTVTYSWKTTDYADIAGTMRVYRCNPNGSVFIVESLPITGGIATANIELLTAQYKYDVIIGSTVYQQESFFTCHIESLTARSFFVDISNVSLAPVIGLYMIDCTLDLLANTTIDMRWTENSQDSSTITGCIAAYQSTVFGNTEFYRNCTNTSLQLIRSIPDPGGSFYVNGLVYQNDVQGYCQNTITFDRTTNAATQFGATMVFSIMFLILGISLVYAGKTTESLLGAGVAIVLSYFLGIIALPWTWVAAALSLLIAIALLIRYGRGGQ